jgi:hypothetical protein
LDWPRSSGVTPPISSTLNSIRLKPSRAMAIAAQQFAVSGAVGADHPHQPAIARRADGDRPAQHLLAAAELLQRELARNAGYEIERAHALFAGDVAGRHALAGEA